MHVRIAGGDEIGKVSSVEPELFEIAQGLLFKDRYTARYEDVEDIEGDTIVLLPAEAPAAAGPEKHEASAGGRMQLKEEQLEAVKTERQTGAVEVRKVVDTEERTLAVPVRKEHLEVSRVPGGEASPADASFHEETIRVPLHEEEVEIRKRPIVREEVRVSAAPEEETRTVREEIRKERAEIHGEGEGYRAPGKDEP